MLIWNTQDISIVSPWKDLLDYPNARYNGKPWKRWRFPRMKKATEEFLRDYWTGTGSQWRNEY